MSSNVETNIPNLNQPVFGLKYRILKILLLFTGLRFRRYGSKKQFKAEMIVRILMAVAYICLVTYVILCFIIVTADIPEKFDNQGDISRSYILIFWMLLILFKMIIIFYWEIRDFNRLAIEDALQYEFKIDRNFHPDWATRTFLFGFSLMLFLRIVGLLIGVLANSKSDTIQRVFIYEILTLPFGQGFGVVFTSIIIIHVFSILFINLLFYALPTFAIRYRLLYLKVEFQKLGEQREENQSICEFYHGYRRLMQSVSGVNERFQLYRVITMFVCILVLAITVYTFYINTNHKWLDYMYLMSESVSIIIILMTLVYPASAIKNTLGNIKYILYYNTQLWFPYDQHVYEFNKLYAEMADLAANEVSIWGLQYARKPFVATVGFIGFVGLMASKIISLPAI